MSALQNALRTNLRRALVATSTWDCMALHRMLMAEQAMGTQHRSVFRRLQNILWILREGHAFNATTLANATGMTTKTIGRDIDFLRKQGIEITYLKHQYSYQLAPGQNHPWLQSAKGQQP